MASCDFITMGLRIRAVDCPRSSRVVLTRLLGPDRPAEGLADVRLRFVDRMIWSKQLQLAGPDAAWDGRNFGIRQPGGWVQIPFGKIDDPPYEVVCERAVTNLSILRPLLQIHALRKGLLPCHGSAFTYGGYGFIATGWPRAAKTGIALAAIDGGGEAIAAENSAVHPETLLLFQAAEPFRVRPWHIVQFRGDRLLLAARSRRRLLLAERFRQMVSRDGPHLRRLAPIAAAVGRHNWLELWPHQVPYASRATQLRAIICLIAKGAKADSVSTNPSRLGEQRLLLLFDEELAPLSKCYRQYQFLALPGEQSPLDEARRRYQVLLRQVLERVPCHELLHANSPPFAVLLRAVQTIADAPNFDGAAVSTHEP